MAQKQQKRYVREVAHRVFASELRNTEIVVERDEDDQYAAQYVITPTGAKVNRVLIVGTLTEIEDISTGDDEYWRARLFDPTGATLLYVGQYQPDATRALLQASEDIPVIIAVVGKVNAYVSDTDVVSISVRPETVALVDAVARDRWIVETARQTLARIQTLEEYHPDSIEDMKAYRHMVGDALKDVLI